MIEEDLLKYSKKAMIENLIFFDNPISRFYKVIFKKNYKLK